MWDQRFDEFSPNATLFYDKIRARDGEEEWRTPENIRQARGPVYEAFSTFAHLPARATDEALDIFPQQYMNSANDFDEHGYRPTFHAVNSNDLEAISTLKDLGQADYNQVCAIIGSDWFKPTFYAAVGNKCRVMTALNAAGADLKAKCTKRGGTPAYFAAKNGNCAMLRVLHQCGVDLNFECITTDNIRQQMRETAREKEENDRSNYQAHKDAQMLRLFQGKDDQETQAWLELLAEYVSDAATTPAAAVD